MCIKRGQTVESFSMTCFSVVSSYICIRLRMMVGDCAGRGRVCLGAIVEEDEGGEKEHLESHLQCSSSSETQGSSSPGQTHRWLISLSGRSGNGFKRVMGRKGW